MERMYVCSSGDGVSRDVSGKEVAMLQWRWSSMGCNGKGCNFASADFRETDTRPNSQFQFVVEVYYTFQCVLNSAYKASIHFSDLCN